MLITMQEHISKFSTAVSEAFPGGLAGAVVSCIASLVFMRCTINALRKNATKAKIRKRAAKRQENVETLRKQLETLSKEIDESITKIPFKELQRRLQTGELSCTQVILAYQAKALAVHDKCNCVTGFILDAEDRARKLDRLNASERGPLHGIPLSMKEVVGVAGEDCTAGLSHFIDKIYKDYGIFMQVMIKQGAIPFARTNICQAQVGLTCSNPIYGVTTNPLDQTRTPGGSSGGEGALIGGGGSILGLACDMGGSTRVPASFCGACGLKPTADRMSGAGNLEMGRGIVTIGEIYGPMGRDVDSLVAMIKAALVPEMFRLDPLISQLLWREELYTSSKPMTIGFYTYDGGVEPVPAVKRAMGLAKQALETMGHKVVEFAPINVVDTVTEFGLGSIFSDDGLMFEAVMRNEVIDPSISVVMSLSKVPFIIRRVLSKLLFFVHPVDRKMMLVKASGNVFNWWCMNERVESYRREFTSSMLDKGLDAFICPAFPVPAWPINDTTPNAGFTTYTLLHNVTNLPCGVVTVTRINADDVKNLESYPKKNVTDKFVHRLSKGSENLPIPVQAVSYPFKEEVTLRVLKEIELGLHKMGQPYV